MTKETRTSRIKAREKARRWPHLVTGIALALCLAVPPVDALAAEGYDQVAGKASLASAKELATYGMTPVEGSAVADGEYEVKADCSSSFFKIEKAKLTVKDGEMTAVLTMSSSSYLFVYPGTAEEAAAAPFEDYIPSVDIDTWDTFTIPVEALDKEIDLAAYSKRRKKWYPRKVLFHASDIPADKLSFVYPDYERIAEAIALYDETNGTDSMAELKAKAGGEAEEPAEAETEAASAEGEPEAVAIEEDDGEYSIEVDLVGGSGRASVTSPTWLYVRDGKAYAKLLWSSSYYDYMIVEGKKFFNETTDGSHSTFTIPITNLEEGMTVIADTTAMGDPLEIEYTLTFYADTVDSKSRIPQEATKKVLVIALVIMIAGGIVNYFVKKRRQ